MLPPRRFGAYNPANWYLLLGLLLLATSLWVPWLTAQRTTRIEKRAEHVCELMNEAVRRLSDPFDPALLEHVLARLHALASARGVLLGDLEVVEPPLPDLLLLLRNKHYLFGLAESRPEPNLAVGRDTAPAREITAWPASEIGPGHCAFFHPEDAPRAYTRNLTANYHGTAAWPTPGSSHRSARGGGGDHPRSYRGSDDERWQVY